MTTTATEAPEPTCPKCKGTGTTSSRFYAVRPFCPCPFGVAQKAAHEDALAPGYDERATQRMTEANAARKAARQARRSA